MTYCENNINNDDKIWDEAMKDEIQAHLKNGTWFLIEKKENQKVIGCKMILKEKYISDGMYRVSHFGCP